jgi:hypothetical protein
VAAAAVSLVTLGLSGCGSHHHHVATPASTTSTTSTTTVPPTTTTTAPKPAPTAPLTGLAASTAAMARPAVVVKIDNVAGALPQTGINEADVVYEEMVEGGLTRLAAVFQSQQPTTVGPVRSGRLTDEGIADDLNHPVLAYSGTNGIFQPILDQQPVTNVNDDNHPSLFVRNPNRPEPHNLYASVAALAATDSPSAPPSSTFFSFRSPGQALSGPGLAPASAVSIPFPAAQAQWTWSPSEGVWLRTQNGVADVDTSGVRFNATNVIVQFVPYITSGYATGEGLAAPEPIPEGELVGSGVAWVLSGGAIIKGSWSRASLTTPTVYKDAAGNVIKLGRGRTWIELPPAGTAVTVTG